MSEGQFQFTLRTPIAEIYSGTVDSVHLETDTGEMEVLVGHASTIGSIQFSVVKIRRDKHVDEYVVRQGILSIDESGDSARIIAQYIEKRSDMRVRSLEEYRTFILDRLKEPERLSKYQVKFLENQRTSVERSMEVFRTDEIKDQK